MKKKFEIFFSINFTQIFRICPKMLQFLTYLLHKQIIEMCHSQNLRCPFSVPSRRLCLWARFRKFSGWSLGLKTPGLKCSATTKIECYNYTEARYAVFFATIMGCVASPITSWCVMGLNYTLCVYDGLKIVFKYKKEGHSNTRKSMVKYLGKKSQNSTVKSWSADF